MEYVLHNTDIFDNKIDQKLKEVIIDNKDDFSKEKIYIFKVSFHVNLLDDERFGKFDVPVLSKRKTRKETEKDKIYDVMSYQLERMNGVLNKNEIETYSTTIQGDYLDSEDIIKIEIIEDTSEVLFTKKGKKKNRMKVSCIVPSLPFTQDNITELSSERINEIYWDFMSIIKNKKIMAEILEVDENEDDIALLSAFADQYGELWLTTNEREKELIEQFKNKAIAVLNKYREQEENNESL